MNKSLVHYRLPDLSHDPGLRLIGAAHWLRRVRGPANSLSERVPQDGGLDLLFADRAKGIGDP